MNMFKKLALVLTLSATSIASATVLDFEDLAGRPNFKSMPTLYAGIDWAENFWAYGNTQSPYTAHSGKVRIASNGASPGDSSFSFSSDVTFDGLWVAGATNVAFKMYDNNSLVGTSSTVMASAIPKFLTSNYSGAVNRVQIIGGNGAYVFDDVQYNSAVVTANSVVVPEPETYTLLLAGLGLMGFALRRRKTS